MISFIRGVGGLVFAMIETVFYAFRYVNNKGKRNIAEQFMNDYYEKLYMNAGKMNGTI